MTSERRAGLIVTLLFFALGAGLAWLLAVRLDDPPAPEQPIPFSHRVHAGRKAIACLFCHDTAASGENAGLPPLQTCMLCHLSVAIYLGPIRRMRRDFDEDDPVRWIRVARLPDFAYFPHDIHVRAGIDCGRCHGDVKRMDRVMEAVDLEMGLCMDCHGQLGVTRDCLACHR